MCLSYCHRRAAIFWNHVDCQARDCDVVLEQHGHCQACAHQQGDYCGLTTAPLPVSSGCCHWNVEPATGWQEVSQLSLITTDLLDPTEPLEFLLERLAVPYQHNAQGQTEVDPTELALPLTYGLGTETATIDAFDWSGWFEQWEACQ